jgi:hypothetical protein
MTQLHQMTMSFSPQEDRLLLKVSTTAKTEIHLWLTRRFTQVLWNALMQAVEKNPDIRPDLEPKAREAVKAMQHQEAVQAVDLSQKHDEKKENKPITEKPLLVTGGKVEADGKLVKLTFLTAENQEINMALNKELLHALCHLMMRLSATAEWGLDLAVGDGNVVVPEGQHMVH